MVQTHFNVGVHFVNLHVNIVFEKIIFYYFMFTIVKIFAGAVGASDGIGCRIEAVGSGQIPH